MKKSIIPVFLALACIQWWVPASMIVKKETVLTDGKQFKFLTQPVDPSNPFKGKFIALNFKASVFIPADKNKYSTGQEIYVHLITDDSGYAKIAAISANEPTGKTDYIKAIIEYIDYDEEKAIHIQYPFEEFYMDEYKAPQAESIYRERNRDIQNKTYALVKILNGDAVIEDVLIDDIPIRNISTNNLHQANFFQDCCSSRKQLPRIFCFM